MRKALLLHHDFYSMFALLTDEEAGRLIKAAFEYDIDGITAEFDDRLMEACYLRLIDCIDKNHEHYEEARKKKIEAANKRWEKGKEDLTLN